MYTVGSVHNLRHNVLVLVHVFIEDELFNASSVAGWDVNKNDITNDIRYCTMTSLNQYFILLQRRVRTVCAGLVSKPPLKRTPPQADEHYGTAPEFLPRSEAHARDRRRQ